MKLFQLYDESCSREIKTVELQVFDSIKQETEFESLVSNYSSTTWNISQTQISTKSDTFQQKITCF